jgi:pyridoxamine 5'-phosphate oxidase
MTVTSQHDPIELFKDWMDEAERTEPSDANAMNLSTVSAAGVPSSRMVLLKDVDQDGFTFYTNLGSRKAKDMKANPRVALCFHWKSQKRQIRIEGTIEAVDEAEANAYFASRDRASRIGAWASKQSQVLVGHCDLEKRVAEFTSKFHVGEVLRPEFWSGYRVIPLLVEFWTDKPFRLHERLVYHRVDDKWTTETLYP